MLGGTNGMIASERPKYWQSRVFTSSGTWTVPADVGVIWVDAVGGGAGGGGGHTSATTGGGGGGGSSAPQFVYFPIPVAPGETLTLTVGAGGVGGAAGAQGWETGRTEVIGTLGGLYMPSGGQGYKGDATMGGGSGGYGTGSGNSSTVAGVSSQNIGQTGWAVNSSTGGVYLPRYTGQNIVVYQAGAGGGGPGYAGGASFNGPALIATPQNTVNANRATNGGTASGTAGSGMGGGGAGGNSYFGDCGVGGNAGAAGGHAQGYGAGGGGGGCNAQGGNGSPGFIRIYCLSSFPI